MNDSFSLLEKYDYHKSIQFRIGDKLSKISKDIPNLKGVYIIYKDKICFENIVYIGKAGTLKQLGSWGEQGLKKRINNKQEGVKRQLFFENKMREQNISLLIIEAYTSSDDKNIYIPSYVEACLIQEYYERTKKLPTWNKGY